MHHFPKQMSASASRMHLLARHHIARAHRVLFAFSVLPATLADADTTQGGVRETAMIVREFEVGLWIPRTIVRSQTKVLIDAIRIDDFPRIHHAIRIPYRFELAERFDQFGA